MSCNYGGDPDLYGLGIRIGFYLLWFGTIAASWFIRSEVPSLRLMKSLFVSATFLALIIQASTNSMEPIDAYVALLLAYGSYYALVPVFIWRLLIACNPFWDPSRWPRVKTTTVYRRLELVLLIAITCFQMWFWTTGVNGLPGGQDGACQQWGFFFAQVPLDAPLFIAANIAFVIILLVCCTAVLAVDLGFLPLPRWIAKQERRYEKTMKRLDDKQEDYPWRRELQFVQTASDLTVATVVVIAVELTIQWNTLTGVNDVSEAAQTIPLIVAAGLVTHAIYVWINPFHSIEILEDMSADLPEMSVASSSTSDRQEKRRRRRSSGGVRDAPGPEGGEA